MKNERSWYHWGWDFGFTDLWEHQEMMRNISDHSLKNRNKTKKACTLTNHQCISMETDMLFLFQEIRWLKIYIYTHICEAGLCHVRKAMFIKTLNKSSIYLDVWGPRCADAARGIGKSRTAARHLCGCLLPLQRYWGQLGVSLTFVACTREVASCTDAPSLLLWCFCLRDRRCCYTGTCEERPPLWETPFLSVTSLCIPVVLK